MPTHLDYVALRQRQGELARGAERVRQQREGMAIAPTLLGNAKRFGPARAPQALIIAPTRELALQVKRHLDRMNPSVWTRVLRLFNRRCQ